MRYFISFVTFLLTVPALAEVSLRNNCDALLCGDWNVETGEYVELYGSLEAPNARGKVYISIENTSDLPIEVFTGGDDLTLSPGAVFSGFTSLVTVKLDPSIMDFSDDPSTASGSFRIFAVE